MKNFRKWIYKEGGPVALGASLGIEPPTIRAWLRRETSPKAVTMRDIIRYAKGDLTYDDIIDGTKGKSRKRY